MVIGEREVFLGELAGRVGPARLTWRADDGRTGLVDSVGLGAEDLAGCEAEDGLGLCVLQSRSEHVC